MLKRDVVSRFGEELCIFDEENGEQTVPNRWKLLTVITLFNRCPIKAAQDRTRLIPWPCTQESTSLKSSTSCLWISIRVSFFLTSIIFSMNFHVLVYSIYQLRKLNLHSLLDGKCPELQNHMQNIRVPLHEGSFSSLLTEMAIVASILTVCRRWFQYLLSGVEFVSIRGT